MNLQTIRQLENALTAFGADKKQTMVVGKGDFVKLEKLPRCGSTKCETAINYILSDYRKVFIITTSGGFVITVIEKQ